MVRIRHHLGLLGVASVSSSVGGGAARPISHPTDDVPAPDPQATAGQAHTRFTDATGTLAGFRMPAYEQGISVSGYHLHYLDADRSHGGHCLDFEPASGTIDFATLTELHLSVPRTAAFRDATMGGADTAEQIRRTEGGH
ncbi:acetolactate decarboxylase [Mycolicibacterium sp. S2-37]|nr:acetolactate decarboxylase [Mycolicibacterium sp. S2-37]